MASPSSSCNWVYDVFPSFSGEDVRQRFLSHFLRELDRKLIIAFKDNEIERSHSLDPELKEAIRTSRIAVVVFSKNYASSSWCLNELLEIVKCKKEFGQIVIPVFYDLDPSHVRKQKGEFGKIFKKTCKSKTEEEILVWQQALTDVANTLGYHSEKCPNEAKMIDAIANDILDKLNLTPSKDFEEFVGMEDHFTKMSELLHLDSDEVRMVGIWGPSGIGKTTIARALYGRLSPWFQGNVFIDRAFVSKSMENYSRGYSDDYSMKLHLQRNFLSEILGKDDIKIDHLGAVRNRLKHQKVLIVIDDLDDQVVLDALAGQCQWFGGGSRIIVVTNDKHLLTAHEINHIYEVVLPSEKLALEMLCQSAFRQNSPPEGFKKLAVEVTRYAGRLPLGLNVLGSHLRGRNEEYWMDMLPRFRNSLDGKIEKTLRVSYDGLGRQEDKVIFRHIACLFNGVEITDIRFLLANSNLGVNIGLENLVDKSLIHVRSGIVEMHRFLEEMGRKIVREQSIEEPGKREFLVDSKDIIDVLDENTGTNKVLGISLNIDEIDELHVHENAFKGMRNLRFLKIFSLQKKIGLDLHKNTTPRKEVRLQLPESFDYLPHSLKSLRWDGYPLRCMPSKFCPENLVEIKMQNSKLEKLWEGVALLTCLKKLDLSESEKLKELPDLSMATNLEKIHLNGCSSLVALTSSIRNLRKLKDLIMSTCTNLETLPTGMNLKSLFTLFLDGCSRLKNFPDISTNISHLHLDMTSIEECLPSKSRLKNLRSLSVKEIKSEKLSEGVKPLTWLSPSLMVLRLSHLPNLVEIPASIQNLTNLKYLTINECINLEILPTDINLKFLKSLNLSGCLRLKSFPYFSTNITDLNLCQTGFEEVLSCWIEKFTKLEILRMRSCNKLEYVSLNLFKLQNLLGIDFSKCGALTKADLYGYPNKVAMNPELSLSYFYDCFKLDQEALLQQQLVFKALFLSGAEVPSYFTHRSTGTSSLVLSIPLHLSTKLIRFRLCAAIDVVLNSPNQIYPLDISVKVNWRFKGNQVDSHYQKYPFVIIDDGSNLIISDYIFSVPCLSYDDVDIQLQMSSSSTGSLKGWGIRLVEECSSPVNQLGYPNTLPHVSEASLLIDECLETQHDEEGGDNSVEIETSRKRKRKRRKTGQSGERKERQTWGFRFSRIFAHAKACRHRKRIYLRWRRRVMESHQPRDEEGGDNNVETETSRKRMRVSMN